MIVNAEYLAANSAGRFGTHQVRYGTRSL